MSIDLSTFDDERPGHDPQYTPPPLPGKLSLRQCLFGTAMAGFLGALFAAISTADFIEHLDRQVHSVHCSFIPGAAQNLGESGCRTVMLSPYSSLFRESLWGGLPISLLALAVFGYLMFRGLDFASRPHVTQKETRFLVAATLLPVGMSLLYGFIAAFEVGAACKLCIGVYFASVLAFVLALLSHRKAPPDPGLHAATGLHVRWFLEGVVYVAALSLLYLSFAPVSDKSAEGCGALASWSDPSNVLVPLGGTGLGPRALAVLDPLCPACKSFDQRIEASGFSDRLQMDALLFPLDAECNWMVKESLHPGACAVSEAILCDPARASEMMSWAFEHQEALMATAGRSPRKLRQYLARTFPKIKGCLGSARVKNKLNKSLRFAVKNALPVLTPQLFIGDRRVCDEDTDLGLEYTISSMLSSVRQENKDRRRL